MADVQTTNPEINEVSERDKAAGDALRSDASLEGEAVSTTDTGSEHLPSLIIAQGTEETPKDADGNPTYTAEAATVAANDLSAEVHKGNFLGLGGPNYDVILTSFQEKTPDQIQRMQAAYELGGGDMMADIKAVVTDQQYRVIEGLATTREGETNWAGNLANLFEVAQTGDQVRAGQIFREMFNTMPANGYTLLAEQWGRNDYSQYGETFEKAIDSSNLSDMNKWLFQNFYNVPFSQRDTALYEKAAHHILDTYGAGANADQLLLYGQVMGAEGDAAKEARENLAANPEFAEQFKTVFQNAPGWQDYLVGTTVSLNTTVTQNTDALARFFGGGKTDEAIEYDLSMATADERAAFIAGKNGTGTAEQIAFYNQLNETFNQRGSAEQAAIWADVMAHGKRTIVSELATRSDNNELNEQTALMMVENMSEEDWNRLHSDSSYLAELTTALSGFAPDYQQAITEKLTKMSEAGSYADAQGLRRSFGEIFAGATENNWVNTELLAYAMKHMSAADVAKYNDPNDTSFRQMIDGVVNPPYGSVERLDIYSKAGMVYAQSMLKQAEAGKVPVEGDLERIALTMMNEETRPEFSSEMLNDLMSIPEAFSQIKTYTDATANGEQEKRSYFGNYLTEMAEDLDPASFGDNMYRLLRNERMDATYLSTMEGSYVEGYSPYSHLKDSPNKDADLSRMSADEREVAQKVIDRNGETTQTDFDRLYMIGVEAHRFGDKATDAVGMMEMLSSLSETERQQRFADYQSEYGSASFMEDFKARAAQENLSPEYQAVVDNFIKQGGMLLPADVAQLAVLKGGDAYKTVLPLFSQLSFEARDLAKSDFAEKYQHDLAPELLGMIPNNSEETSAMVAALKSSDIDPIQQYLDRVTNFDNTGVDVDGSRESMLRALQINGDLIQQYSEDLSKLPPDMVKALDQYFVHTVEQNRDSKGRVAAAAQAALDLAVIAAAAVTLLPSGGTSAAVAGGILATSAKAPIAAALQGGRMISEEEMTNLLKESALEAGLFMAPGMIARATKGFNDMAQSGKLKTLISGLTHSDDVALAPVKASPETVVAASGEARAITEGGELTQVADDATRALDEGADAVTAVPKKTTAGPVEEVASTLDDQAKLAVEGKAITEAEAALATGATDDVANAALKATEGPTALATVEQTLARTIAPGLIIENAMDMVPEQTDFTPPPPVPNAQIIDLATVRRGEGPWHSAERILAATGKPYGVDEVRALVKAMKVVYAQDNGSTDMSGLKVQYNFVTNDNFDNLIEAVDNPAVEEALKGFAMAS